MNIKHHNLALFPAFICLVMILLVAPSTGAFAATDRAIQIGLLFDVNNGMSERFTSGLRKELSLLLGNQYAIKLPAEKVLTAKWTSDSIRESYHRLVADPDIDIVVSVGALSAATLTQQKRYPKPLIVLGVIDYELQGIPLTAGKQSGTHNLTYVLQTQSFTADLADFRSLYPYQHLAIIYDRRITELLPGEGEHLVDVLKEQNSHGSLVTYDGDMDALLKKIPEEADAVMLSGLYALTLTERQQLIDHINNLQIPSYSFLGVVDVKRGVLAGANPEANWQRLTRRIALNVERILDGQDPAELPTLFNAERQLTINMETARKIDFSPTWSAMANAEVLNIDAEGQGVSHNFSSIIDLALQANLALEIEQLTVDSAIENIAQARAQLLPSISASVTGVKVDEESAGTFQAENTYGGSLTLDQLVYSEQAYANLAVQKHLLNAAEEKLRAVVFDTILNAGQSYLDILQAKSAVKINRINLRLVRKNLDVAEYRQRVGYAGAADVYRLRSEIASATSGLLETESLLRKTELRLNEIIKRPLNEEFYLEEVDLAGNLMKRYGGDKIKQAVSSPRSLERLTQFLVAEAMDKLPEVRQLRDALAAQERLLLSSQRQRWLPTVSLRGKLDKVFDRSGIGSSMLDDNQKSWNISLAANWELFAGGEISSEIKQATLERNKLQKELLSVKRGLELALRNALLDLRVKSANLELTKISAEAAQGNYQLVQDSYAQGRATVTGLLDARNATLKAEQSAANSVYEYYVSVLQVERAMGDFALLSSQEDQEDFYKRFETYMETN